MVARASADESAVGSLANAVFIGYMMGCHSLFGRRTQVMGNLIGEHVGEEVLKYARAQGFTMDSLKSVETFFRDNLLAGTISIGEEGEDIVATIEECGVCPKRVGHCQFDGTACPWPGLLAGVLLAAFRERLIPSASLVPTEICSIRLRRERR